MKLKSFGSGMVRGMGLWALMATAACSSGGEAGSDEYDRECAGCRVDGQSCVTDTNCASTLSKCNNSRSPLFVPEQPAGVCVQVRCDGNQDCAGEAVCSLAKRCAAPSCQSDDVCGSGQACIGGQCEARPPVESVDGCRVVGPRHVLGAAQSVKLSAIALRGDRQIPGIQFEWSAAPGFEGREDVVALSGSEAKAGDTAGQVEFVAHLAGRADFRCEGRAIIETVRPAAPDGFQIRVVDEATGAPVDGADVLVMLGGPNPRQAETDDQGIARIPGLGGDTVASVTVRAAGWQWVTVVAPGGLDLFVPLPRTPDRRESAGFRGVVDNAALTPATLRIGLVAPALSSNFLNLDVRTLLGDVFASEINIPQVYQGEANLPGALVLGFGDSAVTASSNRCLGRTPADRELGCYLAQTTPGSAGLWSLSTEFELDDLNAEQFALVSELVGAGGSLSVSDIDFGRALAALLPLLREARHGAVAGLDAQAHPRVPAAADGTDCDDLATPNYLERCRPDYEAFPSVDVESSASLALLSAISVPDLPALPTMAPEADRGCLGSMVVLGGVNAKGTGLVPLGVSAGLDDGDGDARDCRVAGTKEPFGPFSRDLPKGQLGLSMAHRHAGLEDGKPFVLAIALDADELAETKALQLSAAWQHVDRVERNASLEAEFAPVLSGRVHRGDGRIVFEGARDGTTMVRAKLERGNRAWIVYAPPGVSEFVLPAVTGPDADFVERIGDAYLYAVRSEGSYADAFRAGSGFTLDRLADVASSFSVQQCVGADAADRVNCVLE